MFSNAKWAVTFSANIANFLFLTACSILLSSNMINAQSQQGNISTSSIKLDVSNMPLPEVLTIIEQQTNFKFAYNSSLAERQKNITLKANNLSLNNVLNLLFKDGPIEYTIIDNQIVLKEISSPSAITISGYIKESLSGESLNGASIYIPGIKSGTFSNDYGFYSITITPADSVELVASYVGHRPIDSKIAATKNIVLNLNLSKKETLGTQITIVNNKIDNAAAKNHVGTADIFSSDIISATPAITGNGDILNTVEMQPGVQAGLNGTPGYYVRGGNADQNLIQLDEAELYNPTHLLGLVSIFNTEAIKIATLIKSGIPASYGDHLSSILDVSMKDGNNQNFGGNVQLGTIFSGFTVNGPIAKEKASFLLSARRSTIDYLIRPFQSKNYLSNYHFYDIDAKLNIAVSQRDHMFFSLYQGLDKGSYLVDLNPSDSLADNEINYGINYGNTAATLRWNHSFSGKLFSNSSFIYNTYHQSVSAIQKEYYAQLYSGIKNINLKTDFYYYPSLNHRIKGGINYLYQTLLPASVSDIISATEPVTKINLGDIPHKNANRLAVYLSDNIKLTQKLSAYVGIRMPLFFSSEIQYVNLEPRLSFLYRFNSTTSIKVDAMEVHQYLHLVQSYNASFPAEIWINSSPVVKPQISQQFSSGFFKNLKENKFELGIETYYKLMGNQLLFKGVTQPAIDNKIEEKLIFGKGWSYGTEVLMRKNSGKLTGWIGYALSFAYQQFDSLNSNQKFPLSHNRKQNLYMSASYAINQQWRVSSNFLIASGAKITLNTSSPSSGSQNNNPLFDDQNDYGSFNNGGQHEDAVNNYRLTPYNRLDLSISYKKSKKVHGRLIESEWIFSIYNVYAHQNSAFAFRTIDPVSKQPIIKEISLIPVIPSILYSLRF